MKMGSVVLAQGDARTAVTVTESQLITLTQVSITTSHASATGPTVTLVQLPKGQMVHSVIQATQPSVIQSPQLQAVQISTRAETGGSKQSVDCVTDSLNRREILSRCPRRILNDLSSNTPAVPRNEDSSVAAATCAIATVVPTPIYQTCSGQYITIPPTGAFQLANNSTDGVQGPQTLNMTYAAAVQPGATIYQYTRTSNGQQMLVPSNQVVVQAASGNTQAYQIEAAHASTDASGVVMALSSALPTQGATEKVDRNRELRLMRNREAARECRRKKKMYMEYLKDRLAVLDNENETLIEEVKGLKDLYCHTSE